MNEVLARILADKREEVGRARTHRSLADLESEIRAQTPARGFIDALSRAVASGRPAVIAEMKRASPSRGVLRANLEPAAVARAYERAGAAALSVLTDEGYFGARPDDLAQARAACALPVLRKDFMIDSYQIAESRAMGADCVLLIAAALDDGALHELFAASRAYGLDALIEVHDAPELERALTLPGGLLGINNRDLRTFFTSIDRTLELVGFVPPGRLVVTESGILGPSEVARLKDAGLRGFLVGEAFMVAPDPGARLGELFEGWAHEGSR
ncbi:MAG: indole-3-glycerol phosphate synthase TrpC [Acidiferrobacter sp.]